MLLAKAVFCWVERQTIGLESCLCSVQFFSLMYESFFLDLVGFEISNRHLRLKNQELFLFHAHAWRILLLIRPVNMSFVFRSLSWCQPLDRLSAFQSLTAKLAFSLSMASPGSTARSCLSISLASEDSVGTVGACLQVSRH